MKAETADTKKSYPCTDKKPETKAMRMRRPKDTIDVRTKLKLHAVPYFLHVIRK